MECFAIRPALPCELNDLWKYSSGEWTWMGGSNVVEQPGTYGSWERLLPATCQAHAKVPCFWTAPDGTFWLFGGFGFDSTRAPNLVFGDLNDLWKYSGGEWTWIGGSDLAGQIGTYGTKGQPSPSNVPGARDSTAGWSDQNGNLWFFGGSDYWISGGGKFNDLWEYQP